MSSHSYNTRSKKKQPNITLNEKHGSPMQPPKDPPVEDPDDEGSPMTTIYLDDILKKMDQRRDVHAAGSLINLMTAMANSELHSKNRLQDIKKKRKDKEGKLSPKRELTEELKDLEQEQGEWEEGEEASLESLLHPKKTEKVQGDMFISDSFNFNFNDDLESEYDELDEEYCEICDSENANMEDEEWEYFHGLSKVNKKMFLTQFKEIKGVISETPIRFKVANSKLPLDIKSLAMKKILNISQMDSSSGEYYKAQQWLDTLLDVPFGNNTPYPVTPDSTKDEKAEFIHNLSKTMTDAIYGHKEAKSQILQIVAQSIKNPAAAGNVIAIQGPMGNGKTTLVKEGIAKALGRPFAFIALGGAGDGSYFDGHNFTYEGSRWGRIVDILIQCKCMNPIFYFDELDKVSDTSKGQEIIHLLTHLTDSSQNSAFNDNYFTGVDFDLSKALFIFSFNDEAMVDPILKDRMNVINTDGFDPKDKMKIAKEYLLRDIYKEFDIDSKDIIFPDDTIKNIIEIYTNSEKGVRNLKRCLNNIVSKLNVWTMMTKEDQDDMPYKLKDVTYPYTVTIDTCTALLNKKNTDAPPVGMYL